MTSGMQPSDLVIIAARPSMGKTSFVLNIAQNAALEHGKTVGVFSLEMSKDQLFMRMLTSEARVDSQRLRQGMLLERDLPAIAQAAEKLSMAKVFIDDSASIGVLEMRAKARRLKAEHGLHMLVIDYVQLMQGRGRFENRQQELTSISRSLKALAKELHVPILLLSQLSRAPDARVRSPAAAVRPARVRRARTGRRRRDVHLPRGPLQGPRGRGHERARRSSSPSSATARWAR